MSILSRREVLERLLSVGQLDVVLDTEASGVIVPKNLQGVIMLQLGLDMAVPIEFDLGVTGIHVLLSFDRRPYQCFIPWPAISMIGLTDRGQAVFWGLPDEVDVDADTAAPAPKPTLRVVG